MGAAHLSGADLTGADIEGVSLKDAVGTDTAIWTNVTWAHVTCPDGSKSDDHVAGCFSALIDKTAPTASPVVSPAGGPTVRSP